MRQAAFLERIRLTRPTRPVPRRLRHPIARERRRRGRRGILRCLHHASAQRCRGSGSALLRSSPHCSTSGCPVPRPRYQFLCADLRGSICRWEGRNRGREKGAGSGSSPRQVPPHSESLSVTDQHTTAPTPKSAALPPWGYHPPASSPSLSRAAGAGISVGRDVVRVKTAPPALTAPPLPSVFKNTAGKRGARRCRHGLRPPAATPPYW